MASMKIERREHPRVTSLNLLAYVLMDGSKKAVQQGMGRTLDVSEGGILLETHNPIDAHHTVFLTIGLGEDLADIEGTVAYSRTGPIGRIETGIVFHRPNEVQLEILKKYIKAFIEEKKK